MNCRKNQLSSSLLLVFLFSIAACGVKGDPLPPERPTELGRGRPTYKRATETITIDSTRPTDVRKPVKPKDDDDDENE